MITGRASGGQEPASIAHRRSCGCHPLDVSRHRLRYRILGPPRPRPIRRPPFRRPRLRGPLRHQALPSRTLQRRGRRRARAGLFRRYRASGGRARLGLGGAANRAQAQGGRRCLGRRHRDRGFRLFLGEPPRRRPEVTASPARPEESKASAKPSTAASVGAPSDAKSAAQFPRGEGLDDLDVLPDLESLTDGFISVQGGNRESSPPHQDYEDPEPRRRESGGSGQAADPAMLAQAVRTLLKRDQER